MSRARAAESDIEARIEGFRRDEAALREAVRTVLVGQERALEELLAVFLAGGHALVEGVPGTGKTMLVRALAAAAGLRYRRVQFTPDLLPADILGCEVLVTDDGGRGPERIEFREGPVFTQFLLADEINRGTPRTQSALLESMQERAVTIGTVTRTLDPLFTVLATRNPIEMEGTYPLPEAQLDRFWMQIDLTGADIDEMVTIAERTTRGAEPRVAAVVDGERLLAMRADVRQVIAARPVLAFAARLVGATHPGSREAPAIVRESIRHGASVRALQVLVLAGKVEALRQGRSHLAHQDLTRFLLPVLRHRLIFSLEGEARGVAVEEIVAALLDGIDPDA